MTDLSNVAVARRRSRGIDACASARSTWRRFPLDMPIFDAGAVRLTAGAPFSTPSMRSTKWCAGARRVARLGAAAANTARLARRAGGCLTGRFPAVQNTPTDWLHLRFFTLPDMRRLLQQRGIAVEQVDGSASLWVRVVSPTGCARGFRRRATRGLARRWPSLFARRFHCHRPQVEVVTRQTGEAVQRTSDSANPAASSARWPAASFWVALAQVMAAASAYVTTLILAKLLRRDVRLDGHGDVGYQCAARYFRTSVSSLRLIYRRKVPRGEPHCFLHCLHQPAWPSSAIIVAPLHRRFFREPAGHPDAPGVLVSILISQLWAASRLCC